MARMFGTDGVRGLANGDLTPEFALSVAGSAAGVLAAHDRSHRPVAVVGRDPRRSGQMLEAAVVAGLSAAGADVVRVGVLPTPAVAYLTGVLSADLGVMISASHNPMPDNGIKLFGEGGHKLPDGIEDEIEASLHVSFSRPTGEQLGRVSEPSDVADRYVEHLLAATPASLTGVRVVVDCANGAASEVAPAAYRAAGADVVTINAEPDGVNINDACGSTDPEELCAAVVRHGAHLGIAHDGDADRCVAVDAAGTVVDGDQIMAVLAVAMAEHGELSSRTLVTTVMSNLGLHLAMREQDITLRTTAVGDRYVLEELRACGYSLGGEQSGHVVMPAYATTGDGLLTALRLMSRISETGMPLARLAGVMRRLPQVLLSVPVTDKSLVAQSTAVRSAVDTVSSELGEHGRVLLRPSGTEQLVRVMVEAVSEETAQAAADRLAGVVSTAS